MIETAEAAGTLYNRIAGNATSGSAGFENVPATVTRVSTSSGSGTRLSGAGRPDDDAEIVTVDKIPAATQL